MLIPLIISNPTEICDSMSDADILTVHALGNSGIATVFWNAIVACKASRGI